MPDLIGTPKLPGRAILRYFYCTVVCLCSLLSTHAQSLSPRTQPGQPVPILLRSSGSANQPNNAYAYYQSQPAPTDPPRIPPTDLRIVYLPNSTTFIPQFPNRIRFTQSNPEETRNVSGITRGRMQGELRTNPDSFDEINRIAASQGPSGTPRGGSPADHQNEAVGSSGPYSSNWPIAYHENGTEYYPSYEASNRSQLLNISSRLLMRIQQDQRYGSAAGGPVEVPGAGVVPDSNSSAYVGNITVGALIGIICGIVTTIALTAVVGLFCYRRRHPTWNTAETDLRVLATHYGSYWDDKTLPHYQFNDRMTWPGETHEEMIALDNDAFLKSLEDLGRVSRPPGKTNWNADDPQQQRQSTKV